MHVFSVRDLREHTGALIHDAEAGNLSLITKRGHPVFLALPFSEELLNLGVRSSIAIKLYKDGIITLEKAAKLADSSVEAFIEKLGFLGIPTVTYSTEELKEELNFFDEYH
jgi:predicted HTH domain antitoxin